MQLMLNVSVYIINKKKTKRLDMIQRLISKDFSLTICQSLERMSTENGHLMGYDWIIDDKNVFLQRSKEYKFPIFAQNKIICFGKDNVSSIQLQERPDWITANLIGFAGGIGLGLTGNYNYNLFLNI